MERHELAEYIKAEALSLGFTVCGIAPANEVAPGEALRYQEWSEAGMHGTMSYLERNNDKRMNPALLVEECRSIIVVAMNYTPRQQLHGISDYAQGCDYHHAVKKRLYTLLKRINEKVPAKGRAFCDSAPVLERYWAVQAGLGWIGRNRQLIIPGKGTKFFIGELLVDIEPEYDTPFTTHHCGNCTRCIESCPSKALTLNGFDARRCLSYLTIEYRGELPENCGEMMQNHFYGCDICQSACPHNRNAQPTEIEELQPQEELLNMTSEKWRALTREQYKSLFRHSAVERCGYEQLMRNINEYYRTKK